MSLSSEPNVEDKLTTKVCHLQEDTELNVNCKSHVFHDYDVIICSKK